MICHFKNLIYENILKVSIKICDSAKVVEVLQIHLASEPDTPTNQIP